MFFCFAQLCHCIFVSFFYKYIAESYRCKLKINEAAYVDNPYVSLNMGPN